MPQVGTQEPQDDFKGKWEVCTPETAATFSAVGYFFGRQLHQTLDIPIGLIDDAWGGSACEAWIRRDLLEKDEKYKPLIARWEQTEKTFDAAKAKASYDKQLADYREAAAKAKAEGKPAPHQPRPAGNPLTGNARPGNIYNGVLKPTIGYGIRGVDLVSGRIERRPGLSISRSVPADDQELARRMEARRFPVLLGATRRLHGRKDRAGRQQLGRAARSPDDDDGQAAQHGRSGDHRHRRRPRHSPAEQARRRPSGWLAGRWPSDYGVRTSPYHSPQYKSMEKQGNKIVLSFDHVGGGLYTFDVTKPVGFAIAGSDKKFVWADAKLVGNDKIEVSSDKVSDPAAVRYAWADNPVCNVYSKEGLPLTPFRTDDWPGVTAEAK